MLILFTPIARTSLSKLMVQDMFRNMSADFEKAGIQAQFRAEMPEIGSMVITRRHCSI